MNPLLVLGLNHTTAPLELRERLAFTADQTAVALSLLQQKFPGTEAVLLSTCNRVELYCSHESHAGPTAEDLTRFLADFHQLDPALFQPHLYSKTARSAVEHLFTVTASLDSMVLGETQILGQVRDAYDAAVAAHSTGSALNPLFQRAISVGKQVMRETPLAEGRVSIASVAVDFARRIFDHFHDKTILSIGAGKMAGLVLQSFYALAPKQLLIANRDAAKARQLAQKFNAESFPLENISLALERVDIVISSTGSTRPIVSAEEFAAVHRRRRYRPMFLIDIALPRDIDPAIANFENVYLYNIDDLQQVVTHTRTQRQGSIEPATQIVAAAVEDFVRAHHVRQLGPFIDQLYQRYHALAQEELARTFSKLPNITDAERAHLQELARRIVNKLLHDPVRALRHADQTHAQPQQYLHAMEQLFKLNPASEDSVDTAD